MRMSAFAQVELHCKAFSASFEEDQRRTLCLYCFPSPQWKTLRTSGLERSNEASDQYRFAPQRGVGSVPAFRASAAAGSRWADSLAGKR